MSGVCLTRRGHVRGLHDTQGIMSGVCKTQRGLCPGFANLSDGDHVRRGWKSMVRELLVP